MKKEFLLLLFMTAVNVGSFQLPSPFIYGADLLNGVMMIFCFKRWEKLRSPYNSIFVTWILLAIYIGFLAITSDYVEGASSLMESLRELYPFGLLIYIVFLLEKEQLNTYIKFLHFLCVAGSVLTVVQSLYGTESLFPPESFYHRGHTDGQNYMINGFLSRVSLPTIYLTQVMFLYNVYKMILEKTKPINLLLLGIYLVAILINFSRSAWSGIILCIVFALIITFTIHLKKFQKAVSYIFLSILVIAIVFSVTDTPVVNAMKDSLAERVDEMFYDIEKKEGNLGSRFYTIEVGMQMYETSPWTGIDLNLVRIYELYQTTDVGYLYTLLTLGLIGLVMLCLWYLVTIIISYRNMIRSGKKGDSEGVILSLLVLTNILFFIVIQQSNQFTFSTACLAITTGLFLVKFNTDQN